MSNDRSGIFAGDDPVGIIKAWLAEAEAQETNDANAAALATVDADGLPDVRVVLVKEIGADGFAFYTNYNSAKAQELDGAGKAAINFHWKSLRRQIRARGMITRVEGARADRYYNSRALASRLGALASQQSQVLDSRATLEARAAEMAETHGDAPERPAFWGGYLLTPQEIEFWADGEHRLHDRFRWRRNQPGDDWIIERLYP
ncbi:pyridoxamine 5'-phosphate oxidase [Halovulum sp. GXIMD14793]